MNPHAAKLNKALIGSNLLLIVVAVFAIKYETPVHKRRDALNFLMALQRTESVPAHNVVFREIQYSLSEHLSRDEVEVTWAGIEWVRTNAMLRTHATTSDGKRYVVQMLLEPTEAQAVERIRTEVIDVTEQMSAPGL